MGFFDSFKTGLSGVADFLTDITGAAVAAAPTIIPILQSTGVIPTAQPTGGGFRQPQFPGFPQFPQGQTVPRPGPTLPAVLPGGAMTRWPVPQTVPSLPFFQNPQFPAAGPSRAPFAPGGVLTMPQFQNQIPGFQTAGLDLPAIAGGAGAFLSQFGLPLIDIVRQGGGQTLGNLTSPFRSTMAGAAAQAHIQTNPVSGKITWFKPAGRPILWSGDLTACRRVGKIATRARRSRGKR